MLSVKQMQSIDPDDIRNQALSDITFYYLDNKKLIFKSSSAFAANTHYDMLFNKAKKNPDFNARFNSGADYRNDYGLAGRIGIIKGTKIISFWNENKGDYDFLNDCLEELLKKKLIDNSTWIVTPHHLPKQVAEIEGIQARSEPNLFDKDKIHNLKGNEKKQALLQIGAKPKVRKNPSYQSVIGDHNLNFINFLENKNIIISEPHHLNYHHGQHDFVIYATDNDVVIGKLEYSVFENIPEIQMIEVIPELKRQGIAKKMVDKLTKEYPYKSIKWGMTTPEGTFLKNKLDSEY